MRFKPRSRALAASALAASLGLAGLVTVAPSAGAAAPTVVRHDGANRYETAANAAAGSTTAVVAVSEGDTPSPDALAAASLAGSAGADILLTAFGNLPQPTEDALVDNGVTDVFLLGGESAVSADVQTAIEDLGITVTRIGGANRQETAAMVADEVGAATTAILVGYEGAADALTSGPIAYAQGYPILITGLGDTLNADAAAALDASGATDVLIVGGTARVSQAVEDGLVADGFDVTRIGGTNRVETAALLADHAVTVEGHSLSNVALVNGFGGAADAFTAAPLVGDLGGITVITDGDVLSLFTEEFFSDNADDIDTIHIFGGLSAISQDVEDDAVAAATTATPAGITGTVTTTGADPVGFDTAAGVSMTADTTDGDTTNTFTVGGVTATQGAFVANTTPGDTITVQDTDGDGDYDTFALTNNVTPSSGMIGAVDEGATLAREFGFITAANTVLRDVDLAGGADVEATAVYFVDGAPVAQATFINSLSIGDTVSLTDTDPLVDTDADEVRLTNAAVTGVVNTLTGPADQDGATGTADDVMFKLGKLGDEVDNAAPSTTPDTLFAVNDDQPTTQVFTVDGAVKTKSQFTAAITAGDEITYSRSADTETFALTNKTVSTSFGGTTADNAGVGGMSALSAAPAADGAGDITYLPTGGTATVLFDYTSAAVTTFKVNGVIVTELQFELAVQRGLPILEGITYDETTKTISVTTATDSGVLALSGPTSTTNDGDVNDEAFDIKIGTVTVADDFPFTTALLNELDVATTPTYYANGVLKTAADFEDYIRSIVAAGNTTGDTLQVIVTASATEYRLTTDNAPVLT